MSKISTEVGPHVYITFPTPLQAAKSLLSNRHTHAHTQYIYNFQKLISKVHNHFAKLIYKTTPNCEGCASNDTGDRSHFLCAVAVKRNEHNCPTKGLNYPLIHRRRSS